MASRGRGYFANDPSASSHLLPLRRHTISVDGRIEKPWTNGLQGSSNQNGVRIDAANRPFGRMYFRPAAKLTLIVKDDTTMKINLTDSLHVTSTGGVWHLSPSNTSSLDTKHMTPHTTHFEVLIINSMMLYSSFFTFICDFGSKTAVKAVEIPSTSAQTLEVISSLPGRGKHQGHEDTHALHVNYITFLHRSYM